MASSYRSDDWNEYKMDMREPHRELEPVEREIAVVGEALTALRAAGVLSGVDYDEVRMLAFRQAVRDLAPH